MRRLVLLAGLVACQSSSPKIEDPILRFAATSAGVPSVLQVTITNDTDAVLTYGVVSYTLLSNLTAFSTITSPLAGLPNPLMSANGVVEGTSAFVFPPLAPGQSATIPIPTFGNTSVSYVAHVTGSDDDYVAASATIGQTITLERRDLDAGLVGAAGTLSVAGGNPCARPLMTSAESARFDFSATSAAWPIDGHEFGGDWQSNGTAATLVGHDDAGTGLFWFVDVCPVPGATLKAHADLDTTALTVHESVSTLVVYFFDAAGVPLQIVEGYALHKPNLRHEVLAELAIPEQTRRIAIAPLSYLASGEGGSPAISNVGYAYDPAPEHAVLWNPMWSGAAPLTAEATLTKTFALSGARLDVEIFAAATFTDPTTFAQVRARFSDGSEVSSDPLRGANFQYVRIVGAAIPSDVTSVEITLAATFGADERSSLSLDRLRLTTH